MSRHKGRGRSKDMRLTGEYADLTVRKSIDVDGEDEL